MLFDTAFHKTQQGIQMEVKGEEKANSVIREVSRLRGGDFTKPGLIELIWVQCSIFLKVSGEQLYWSRLDWIEAQ